MSTTKTIKPGTAKRALTLSEKSKVLQKRYRLTNAQAKEAMQALAKDLLSIHENKKLRAIKAIHKNPAPVGARQAKFIQGVIDALEKQK